MVSDINEESAFRDERAMPSRQLEQNRSGASGDYGARGHFRSGGGQMERERGEREGYEGRFMREGQRSASLERVPMEIKEEGPYSPPRGFYGGPPPDPRDMPVGYGHERMYGDGRMGRADYGSAGHPAYGMDFGRFPSESHRDFGGYNRGRGEPFRPKSGPEQWGYGDRYRGGYDRSRRGNYYGMGLPLRSGYSGVPVGNRYGTPVPFQPLHRSRYGY